MCRRFLSKNLNAEIWPREVEKRVQKAISKRVERVVGGEGGAVLRVKKLKKTKNFKTSRNVMKMYIMVVCVYVSVFARRKLNFTRSSGGSGGAEPLLAPQ